jgi:hypothetical protein
MWPFRRTPRSPVPPPITRDGIVATCHRTRHDVWWSWMLRGTLCHVEGESLPDDWLEASRRALDTMADLGPEIRIVILRHVGGWGPPDAAVLSIWLRPALAPDAFEIIAEADAWGDVGVSIEVANGQINGHWTGD